MEAGICYNLELMIEENSYTPESIRALINRLLSPDSKDVDIIITFLALPVSNFHCGEIIVTSLCHFLN